MSTDLNKSSAFYCPPFDYIDNFLGADFDMRLFHVINTGSTITANYL